MVGRDTLDDRQSQPGAPGGPAQCLINAKESFEYALLVFGFDAPTLVGHDDSMRSFAGRARTDTGLPGGE